MNRFNYFFALLIALLVFTVSSCKKDDNTPKYEITYSGITDNYTGEYELAIVFSDDYGYSWYSALDNVSEGDVVLAKVTDTNNDLDSLDFNFDWSESSYLPSNANAAIAHFTITGELSIAVKVTELEELVVIEPASGKIYLVDTASGDLSYLNTVRNIDGQPIGGLRSLTYNKENGLSYLGSIADSGSAIYALRTDNFIAELLDSDPTQSYREDITGILANEDNNILINHIATGGISGSAIGKYSATGDSLDRYSLGVDSYGGLIFGDNSDELILGGEDELIIHTISSKTNSSVKLTPSTNLSSNIQILDLAKETETGKIYSLLSDDSDKLYLATINSKTGAITEIGENPIAVGGLDNWYHCLAFIPKYQISF